MMLRRKKAFTLVELLVVIAIMAVLLSILIPALGHARKQAQNILCQANLKGYGAAFAIYLDDHDQKFPNSYTWLYNSKWQWRNSTAPWCRWHNRLENLENNPRLEGSFFQYVADKDIHLCPTFGELAQSGLGEQHVGHVEGIPMEPQYTYSMNGFLGQPRKTRFGVVAKSGDIPGDTSRVFSFTEENIMWNIYKRSASNAVLSNNNIVSRINGPAIRYRDGAQLLPEHYNGAFATYHLAPSENIEISEVAESFAVYESDDLYPNFGLCRGNANAVFLDQHVNSMPFWKDTHEYCWPLRNRIPRPVNWWTNLMMYDGY
ncbi:MAG: type II secretion system protein [Planctomycetes bacterium]|nr:type II secretion system protein [Planctomycetota bacterium]